MVSVGRGYSTPIDLFQKVEHYAKQEGIAVNQAHNDGFRLWVKQMERKHGKAEEGQQ